MTLVDKRPASLLDAATADHHAFHDSMTLSEPSAAPALAPASRAPPGTNLVIVLLAAAGFALTVFLFYPGYLTNDASFVYGFINDWQFGDWQSPVMSMLWWLIDPIAPGPSSMFLLIASLYWLGFALLGLAAARRCRWLGMATPIVALMPPAFMMLAMVWRDILFGAVWLVAAVVVFVMADRRGPARWTAQAIALALIGLGILLRPTAIVGAPLLTAFVLWPARFALKRTALLFVPALILGYALIHVVYYVIIEAKPQYPLHSLLVYDLGGITHFTGENQFPVSWSPEETVLLTTRCYDPGYWDPYWSTAPCQFVMRRLEDPSDKVFGTPRLTAAWRAAVTAHPLAYLRHRLAYSWQFLAGQNLTLELYHIDDPTKTPLANSRTFRTVVALHDALLPTLIFRVGFWLMVAVVVFVLGCVRRATPSGAFAIGTTASAILYVMSFCAVGVAADFRYAYWCVLAALAGAVALASHFRRLYPFAARSLTNVGSKGTLATH